ncbi:hypothetical protein OIU78_014691 [Salix suchowensis]|nr:hypothetical protein OIU78_014691 [Salix suchowensis]
MREIPGFLVKRSASYGESRRPSFDDISEAPHFFIVKKAKEGLYLFLCTFGFTFPRSGFLHPSILLALNYP